MTRRKSRRLFKSLALLQIEDMGGSGAQAVLAKISKQQGQMSSAWIDRVRISWILEDVDLSAVTVLPLGVMFYACTTNTGATSDNVVACSASRGGGGVVTLDIKRRIVDNDFDTNSGVGALSLIAECTDATVTADIDLKMCIEVYGRWHTVATA